MILWPGVPAGLRLPVLAYVLCLGAMAAQTASVWLVARGSAGPDAPEGGGGGLMRHAALGGALFLLSDTRLAFNRFHAPLPAAALWILASCWAAKALIASALRPRAASVQALAGGT